MLLRPTRVPEKMAVISFIG